MPSSPYREPEAAAAKRTPTRASASNAGRWVIWSVVAAGATAAAVLGANIVGAIVVSAMYGGLLDAARNTSRRRKVLAPLRTRPYPVVFDRQSAAEPNAIKASAIDNVTVQLSRPLDGVTGERVAAAALAVAPGISVTRRDDAIVLSAWQWGVRDIFVLAQLLATWGDELHAELPIVEVAVTWAKGGPVPSM